LILRDGRRCFEDEASEAIIAEWEAEDGDYDLADYSLEFLSNLIASHLTKGTIEFVSVAFERSLYAFHERIVIRTDGSAERHR
jgi:hypothetical protein